MTEIDTTTSIHQLHPVLPELTHSQRDCVLYYSLGATVDEIAHTRGVNASTVKRQLDEARLSFGGIGLSSVRTVVLVRLMATMYSGSTINQLINRTSK